MNALEGQRIGGSNLRKQRTQNSWRGLLAASLLTVTIAGCGGGSSTDLSNQSSLEILNVSYDPTREFFQDINNSFAAYWKEKHNQTITFKQSHGGSGKQSRSVIDGLEADVVTLALAYDIDAMAGKGLVPVDWQSRLPENSSPYTSTIVFLVRKGNPKQITDWDDLVKPGVSIITPNPKTSGGARWNYLAAWGYAMQKFNGNESKAKEFITQLFKNVPVLDSGARGATTTFVERGIGDVLLAWENEAYLAVNKLGKDKFDIVNPSISILAEPPVSVVDKFVSKHGTQEVATAYLHYLYSEQGQDLAAKHYYRPRSQAVMDRYKTQFPEIKMFTIKDLHGSWQNAQKIHFSDGGSFDQIYKP